VSYGDSWRYDDDGPGYDESFTSPSFDDSEWPSGPGQLGYGEDDESTKLLDATPKIPTVYLRRHVTIPDYVVAARLGVLYDDAFAVWVNGVLVHSQNVQDDLSYGVWASAAGENSEAEVDLDLTTANPFVPGDNVIAVLVKQFSATSTDLSFDLRLTVTTDTTPANLSPILDDPPTLSVEAGDTVAWTLTATDGDGDALTFSAAGLPGSAQLDPFTGNFTWQTTLADVGDYAVPLSVADGRSGIDGAVFHITVTAPPADDGAPVDDDGAADSAEPSTDDDGPRGDHSHGCGCGSSSPDFVAMALLGLAWLPRRRRYGRV
jgi:galactose oxidase